MPAVTVGQLTSALATSSASNQSTFFIEPGGTLANYLNEVGPRVYQMGMWRDLLLERTYLGADGYISLDRDIDAVLVATVNDRPQRVRGMAHDLRFLGNAPVLPERWGLIDLGYYGTKRELLSIQEVDNLADVDPISTLYLYKPDGTVVTNSSITGATVSVTGYTAAGVPVTGSLAAGTNATVTFATPVAWLDEILSVALPFKVDLRTASADPDSSVATLNAGTDTPRYRRFRVSGARDDTYVHILAKRAWETVSASTDIVHLGNLSAWKHALLGKVAEDNANVEHAEYHWTVCKRILDDELNAAMGGAIPVPTLSFGGTGQLFNLY